MKLKLRLHTPDEIKRFVDITSRYREDLSLIRDRYVVDAKSILGIFSMDLNKPLMLVAESENEYLRNDLREFVVA